MAATATAPATAVMAMRVHMARECIKNDRWRNDGGTDADSARPSDRSFSMLARTPARVLRRVFTSVFTRTSDACWHCSGQTGVRARSLLFSPYFSSPLYNVDSWENWSNGRKRARKIRIELKNSSLLTVQGYTSWMRRVERLCRNYSKYGTARQMFVQDRNL